jgi:hypothetical protein
MARNTSYKAPCFQPPVTSPLFGPNIFMSTLSLYEDYYLLRSGTSLLTFRKNLLPPNSKSKVKLNKQRVNVLLYTDDGCSLFLENMGELLPKAVWCNEFRIGAMQIAAAGTNKNVLL